MTVAEGELPDPDGLVRAIEEARTKAELFGPGDEELLAGVMPRVTPLDPSRPAQDLLEDLLDGIRGCWLLYREYADYDDLDDEESGNRVDEEFFEALREQAEDRRDRLLQLRTGDRLGVNYSTGNALTCENKTPAGRRGSVQAH